MTESNEIRSAKLKRYLDTYADGKQTVFSEMVGILPANLSMMLAGKRPISNRMWERIHDRLGVQDETIQVDLQTAAGRALSRTGSEGAQLRRYLDQHGISQKELSDRMQVSTVAVHNMLKARRFRADTLANVLEALGVSEDVLMQKKRGASVSNFVPLVKAGQRRNPDFGSMSRVDLGNRTVGAGSILIEVGNDYMQPALLPGWQVIAAEVAADRWKYTTGLVAVLFADEIVIRRIRRNELVTNSWLTLECDDPAGPVVTVEKQDIQRIWTIESIFYGPPK
ncbi:XRE family transcriptional regulator [Salmonirosea aquatica]|uniref:Helix-turn-helix domain-containing protein n=1 Tax=Salmonirosea aquatica TaxID=2654236 RepID=A0A7C9FFD1_9BACT|nr:helix-turn-helix domain-containing protein [Cytophagaceae bacterium SJW1-29]